ncbi:iron-hydroxamate ABC transporter substrate-binding protein [Paenibacillus paridis]|uniref:iron-hydroxamate ABC transporter substrate-binding protein n=1 Tax=Paenibacillus paridis TaxID=2583376 RepID=UPI00111D3D4F|nr:iron-hydroxamate ABC transporter substrate-binding protein [Paenibacillus paridis]
MQKWNKGLGLGSIFLVFILLMTACGGANGQNSNTPTKTDTASTEAPTAEPEKTTRIYNTVKGDVEIPVAPKRIIAEQYLQTILALGVKPVGASEYYIDNPYTKDLAAGIESTGDRSGTNLEKVTALEPDLIITATVDDNTYEQLSKIAPTVVIPFGTDAQFKGVHEEVKGIGELLGKQEEAEKWLAKYDDKISELRGKLEGVIAPTETFSIIESGGKTFYTFGDNFGRGGQAIYGALQLTPSEIIKNELMTAQWKELTLEVIPDYAADHVLLFSETGSDEFKKSNVWQSIPAVKNNQVYELPADRYWYFDPVSVLAQAEEITGMLLERNKK